MGGKVVVAGASGLTGGAAVRRFASSGEWEVVAVSRRPPLDAPARAQHLAVDLCDERACARAFGAISDATHVIYAALAEKTGDVYAGWSDPAQIAKNAAMLRNLFEPLSAVARNLRHVTLVHGGKAYGCHLPHLRLPLPMRESAPRVPHPNFYFEQEDYVSRKQAGRPWSWTVLRPVGIAGVAIGSPMNPFLMLPLFAALRKEAGLDLPRPAGRGLVVEATDADLLAEALEWAAEAPGARNQIFNVANGDLYTLEEAIPAVAESVGVPLGEPRPYDVVKEVRGMAGLWREMVRRHRLAAPEDVEALFGGSMEMSGASSEAPGGDPLRWGLTSTIKLRQAGFGRCVDTIEMIRRLVRRYQDLRILPPRG